VESNSVLVDTIACSKESPPSIKSIFPNASSSSADSVNVIRLHPKGMSDHETRRHVFVRGTYQTQDLRARSKPRRTPSLVRVLYVVFSCGVGASARGGRGAAQWRLLANVCVCVCFVAGACVVSGGYCFV